MLFGRIAVEVDMRVRERADQAVTLGRGRLRVGKRLWDSELLAHEHESDIVGDEVGHPVPCPIRTQSLLKWRTGELNPAAGQLLKQIGERPLVVGSRLVEDEAEEVAVEAHRPRTPPCTPQSDLRAVSMLILARANDEDRRLGPP
jgi:hypothetical protein